MQRPSKRRSAPVYPPSLLAGRFSIQNCTESVEGAQVDDGLAEALRGIKSAVSEAGR
ncbi:hypothetical protein ACFWBC_05625 [Streptomyces sp. NPDC059985]|uniref:hypothetical protein n=1 Tax=Streptomyces sp. NPDC059985 TaxID=3347025 RepID=UPI0036CE4664